MSFYESFKTVLGLGLDPKELTILAVCLRAVIVFIATLVLVRVADRRFLAKMSAFDVVVGLILASMLARAVNGSAALFPSLVAGFVLIMLHRLLGIAAYHWRWAGAVVKGAPVTLVCDGKADDNRMRACRISNADLLEEARLNGLVERLEQIHLAVFERNGKVSVIPAKTKES